MVDYCNGKDPCNVVIIIGQKIYPFDNLRLRDVQRHPGGHANIHVVATVEGNYDPDKSMAGMQDVLQAHKDITPSSPMPTSTSSAPRSRSRMPA